MVRLLAEKINAISEENNCDGKATPNMADKSPYNASPRRSADTTTDTTIEETAMMLMSDETSKLSLEENADKTDLETADDRPREALEIAEDRPTRDVDEERPRQTSNMAEERLIIIFIF